MTINVIVDHPGMKPTPAAVTVDRRLMAGLRQLRDLGGLPTADGGRIRRAALIRADDLSRLTVDGVAALLGYGVGASLTCAAARRRR